MGDLVLVRHAQTAWSVSGRHTGRTDIPLTAEGEEHARQIAPLLAGLDPVLVLASPLGRARETARLAGFADPQLRDDLLEWDYGDYEGRTSREIHAERHDWWLWHDGAPGGEQPEDVARRADRVVAEAVAADGLVLAFAHGHILRMVGARWLEQPAAFGGRLALGTGAICRLGFEHGRRAVWGWNRT